MPDDVAHMLKMPVVAAHQAAQHGIGIAQFDHQRGDGGGGAAHRRLGGVGRHAMATHEPVVGLPVMAKARVVLGIDAFHIVAQPQPQSGLGDAGLDHGGATDQDRAGQAFVEHQLRRTQHPFVFPFGEGHAFVLVRDGACRIEHRLHEHAGRVHKTRQFLPVSGHVRDGPGRHAGVLRGLRHRRCDSENQA